MTATFDFYMADSRCRATYAVDGKAIRVLSVLNITHAGYHHAVGLGEDAYLADAIAALIAADRKAA